MYFVMEKSTSTKDDKVFVDTDILFRYFAINHEKYEIYCQEGTSGDENLDKSIKIFETIRENSHSFRIDLYIAEIE